MSELRSSDPCSAEQSHIVAHGAVADIQETCVDAIILEHGTDRLVVAAEGGGLLEYSTSVTPLGPKRHILRPASDNPTGPLDRALIVMAPWCNRISGGGFHYAGEFYPLQPNLPPFPMPVHGNAFQSRWQLDELTADSVRLRLISDTCPPFHYAAKLLYAIRESELRIELSVENLGSSPMVFSAGLHPWFVATPNTRVLANASAFLQTDVSGVPTGAIIYAPEFLNFLTLPAKRLDNTLLGWTGQAILRDYDLQVEMKSKAEYLHIFSPSETSGFCCLEPQTAPPDAANLSGRRPQVLNPGQRLNVSMLITHKLLRPGPDSGSAIGAV